MIEAFILKWWTVIVSISTLLAGDCILRGKAFAYIHSMVAGKVDREKFDQELSNLRAEDDKSLQRIDGLQEKMSLISAQNQLIVTRLDAQKDASEQADKYLREIISLIPKN